MVAGTPLEIESRLNPQTPSRLSKILQEMKELHQEITLQHTLFTERSKYYDAFPVESSMNADSVQRYPPNPFLKEPNRYPKSALRARNEHVAGPVQEGATLENVTVNYFAQSIHMLPALILHCDLS